jgi:hypothetical protein
LPETGKTGDDGLADMESFESEGVTMITILNTI